MKKLIPFFLFFISCSFLLAQTTFPVNGVADSRDGLYAFTNATIYKSYNEKIENATLLIRKGKVIQIGTGIKVPEDAVVINCNGKYIYPSFIDLYTNYGLPEPKSVGERPKQTPQMLSNKKGAFSWNEALKPEFNAVDHFKVDEKTAKNFRKIGFGTVLSHQMDGISRGTSTLVLLGKEREHLNVLEENVAHHLSFRKGKSTQSYPSSLMGSIALLRQTYLDGEWYKKYGHHEEKNLSLEAWNDVQSLPQIFDVDDQISALRAVKIADEFDKKYIIKGSGKEYRRIEDMKNTGAAFIIPINFPKAFDVEDPFDALQADLSDLKHWELAPTNPANLASKNIKFALTTAGLKEKSKFSLNLRKAIEKGLTEEQALKALTHTPAHLIGADDKIGSLEAGKVANFIITNNNVFKKETKILHNWVRGKAYIIDVIDHTNLLGVYNLNVGSDKYSLHVNGSNEKPKMVIEINDSTKINVKHSFSNGLISLSFKPEKDKNGKILLSGAVATSGWSGKGTLANGDWVSWTVTYTRALPEKDDEKKDKTDKKKEVVEIGAVIYPFLAYGWENKPTPKTYLFKNATVWTNEKDGVLEQTDVLIRNGKIEKIEKNIQDRSATIIEARGKHLTCGVIDEHSHIAISRGGNEGTQASSAEVRIGDILNSEDINIYRQLSGGVTTSQILHGSANPIGGQSGLIKLRWGLTPEEMKFENAAPFIKFALGENVKQSNWGDNNRTRFPQTRMGVEQVYENYFTLAREYGKLKASKKPYRKDLELEALLEVLESKRFITCHSYQQGEINMLMKVAEHHGFKVNTFTHILEGYKVADKMAAHGAAGSSFSDWWAYKYEVIDAIPYNGAIMHEQGIVTAFNSDNAEMARRLNQEAAKAVMYGGVSEEDAWKFVTLNPAKMLHIDDRVGSIKVGKDADLVLWSDNPLSIYAKAEITLIDGIKYFDRAEDLKSRENIKKERARIIQKMLNAKAGGKETQPVKKRKKHLYHCDDVFDEMKG
jgi:imidazolonepropionase-like amidohydrolase